MSLSLALADQCKRTLRSENDFAFGNSFYTYFESKFVLIFIDKILVSFNNFIIKMFIFLDSLRYIYRLQTKFVAR